MSRPRSPLNRIWTTGSLILTFELLCQKHNGFPQDSPLYTNPPTNADAVFSRNFGELEYRTVRFPTQPALGRSDPDRDIHNYTRLLKRKYPEFTDSIEELTCLEDIHKYFDIHDIWYQGLGFLWEVITQIILENRWRMGLMRDALNQWKAKNYERIITVPIGVDVHDTIFNDSDRGWLNWDENFRAWDLDMVRQKLNEDRLALEPKLLAEREAVEAEQIRLQEIEAERIRQQEAEAERIRLKEAEAERIRLQKLEAERIRKEEEKQRMELEKAAAEAADRAETLRREAAEKSEAEEETRKSVPSKGRNERPDRSQAQNPAAAQGPWYPGNAPPMNYYGNRDQYGSYYPIHPNPQAPLLSWDATQDLRFGPPRYPHMASATSFQGGQMYQPIPQYGPQDARRALYNPHQPPRRNMSQAHVGDSQQSGPIFFRESYGSRHQQPPGPSTPHGPAMGPVRQRGFHGGSFTRGNQQGENRAAYRSGSKPQEGHSHINPWEDSTRQVYVAGFRRLTIETLSEMMSECGAVERVRFAFPDGTGHAFVLFMDGESVDRAIARWNGQDVTILGDSFMMRVFYPRFSPRHPEFQPNYGSDHGSQDRKSYSRRSSNASQPQLNHRINSNNSYHETSGGRNMLQDMRAPPAEEWTPRRISESTPAHMRATGLLPPDVPLPPLISHPMETHSIPGMLHDQSLPSRFGIRGHAQGSFGNENVRPGHNTRPHKNANVHRSGPNMEPLGIRRPNVRGEGLTIKVPSPAIGVKLGSHLDEPPPSASTVASSSTAIPQSEHNSDASVSKKISKNGRHKSKNKAFAPSGESSGTGPQGTSSASANVKALGNSSRTPGPVNERLADATVEESSGTQRSYEKSKAGSIVEKRKPTASKDKTHAKPKSITTEVEKSGQEVKESSVSQSSIVVDAKDQNSDMTVPVDLSVLEVKKTRAPQSPSSPRPGRSTHTSGYLEAGNKAVRSSSMYHDERNRDKEDTYRSQSVAGRFQATENTITGTSDVVETPEVPVGPSTEPTIVDTAPASSTERNDITATAGALVNAELSAVDNTSTSAEESVVAKMPETPVEPLTKPAATNDTHASIEKSDVVKMPEALIESSAESIAAKSSTGSSTKTKSKKAKLSQVEAPKEPTAVKSTSSSTKSKVAKPSPGKPSKESSTGSTRTPTKSDLTKTKTPVVKGIHHPVVAVPLPLEKQGLSPPKPATDKTKLTVAPTQGSPIQAITSWAEDVIRESANSTEQSKEKDGVNGDNSRQQSRGSKNASTKKDVANEKTTLKKTGRNYRSQNKGKGRATTPVISEEKEQPTTHVKNEFDDAKVLGDPINKGEATLTDSSAYADSGLTSQSELPTDFTMPSESTRPTIQGSPQHSHQTESVGSSATAITAPRADPKTPKQPAVTESLSVFGRKKKNNKKKENVASAKKSKKPITSTKERKEVSAVAESSKDTQSIEQKKSLAEVESASKVPLPDTPKPNTPKPADAGSSKGRTLWGLMVHSIFQTHPGRTGLFCGIVVVIFAILIRGAMGAGEVHCLGMMNTNGRNDGGYGRGVGVSFHGSQSVTFVINHAAKEEEGAIVEE